MATRTISSFLLPTMLLLAILGYAGTYTIASLLGLPLYDRYALPMTALVALLILHVTQQPRSKAHTERGRPHLMTAITAIASVGALASLIALGSIYTFDSASYDGARWLTATDAVEQGYNARDIGGSFEWVNYFAQQPGTGVRKRGHFCIKVLLLPAHAKNPAIISRRVYRPPFRDPVIVAAVRQPTRCMHGEPLPTRAAP